MSLFITGMVVGQKKAEASDGQCPMGFGKSKNKTESTPVAPIENQSSTEPNANRDWWPNQLRLDLLGLRLAVEGAKAHAVDDLAILVAL